MLTLVVVAIWFSVVAVYLVRQWWVSELAQAGEGVSSPAAAPLPAAPSRAATMRPKAAPSWSPVHASSAAAR